jgi:hypothetical protein
MPPSRVPPGAQSEGIDVTSLSGLRNASVALLIGTFALSACGGVGTTTPALSTAAVTSPVPTMAVTTAPATTEPTTAATGAPATLDAAVDPADDLEIAAPYSLEPLDERLAAAFVTAMEQSLGGMADVFEIGFRSAVKDGDSQAWVIVMRFPDLPITNEMLLDQISEGASGGGSTVEEVKIAGEPARIVSAQGQSFVVTLVGDDIVMVIGFISKNVSVDVTRALIEAN